MGANVLPLHSAADNGLIDRGIIDDLRRHLGPRVCASILADAALETADRLAALEKAVETRDLKTIRRLAHDLVGMPGQIGMSRVSAVSQNLMECVATSEWTTIRAVADRLLRVGQETLAIFPNEVR